MIKFEYIVEHVRNISEDPGGYFKFGQLIILFFAVLSFLALLIYNILVPQEVSSTDVFLAVVVGILGTILGVFYGSKSEKYISIPRKKELRDYIQRVQNQAQIIVKEFERELKEREKEIREKEEEIKKFKK